MNTPGSVATMSGRRSPRIRPSIFQCCSVRVAMLWEAAERPRRDFEASGLPLKICSSFAPRVTGGKGTLEADHLVDGWKRYKKAMDNIGQTLRPIVFYVCIGGEAGTRLGTQKRDDPASRSANPSFGPSRDRALLRPCQASHGFGVALIDVARAAQPFSCFPV
jgi:hypothetical protein